MPLLRRVIGAVLRRIRLGQGRTLREVSGMAGVSLPYLSEVERGTKEASSEVLAAICRALGLAMPDLLDEVRREMLRETAPVSRFVTHLAARRGQGPRCRVGGVGPVGAATPVGGGGTVCAVSRVGAASPVGGGGTVCAVSRAGAASLAGAAGQGSSLRSGGGPRLARSRWMSCAGQSQQVRAVVKL